MRKTTRTTNSSKLVPSLPKVLLNSQQKICHGVTLVAPGLFSKAVEKWDHLRRFIRFNAALITRHRELYTAFFTSTPESHKQTLMRNICGVPFKIFPFNRIQGFIQSWSILNALFCRSSFSYLLFISCSDTPNLVHPKLCSCRNSVSVCNLYSNLPAWFILALTFIQMFCTGC